MLESFVVTPRGGRLCRRALLNGSVLVGVLHLPPDFTPTEGVGYALAETPQGLRLSAAPIGQSLPEHMQSYDVGSLLHQPIWNKTLSPEVMVVRFISALPEEGMWTVYGASHHTLPETAPGHAWFDVQGNGGLKTIEPPYDATGEGIGQLLTAHAVWPDRQGELYTVPQIQSAWRPHFLSYHKLLIAAARDPETDASLEVKVAKSKVWREISISRIDREYCAFLAHMDDHGLVGLDAPRTAAACAYRSQVARDFVVRRQERPGTPKKAARPA